MEKDMKLLKQTGKDLVIAKLFAEGYSIVERDFRSRFGGIDIVCRKDDVVYFVNTEIKRKSMSADSKSVDVTSKKNIENAIKYYIKAQDFDPKQPYMFKEVEITIREKDLLCQD